MLDLKEILKECKIKYPIGCRFNSTGGYKNVLIPVDAIYKTDCGNSIKVCTKDDYFLGQLFNTDKWAKIVSLPQPQEIQYEIC